MLRFSWAATILDIWEVLEVLPVGLSRYDLISNRYPGTTRDNLGLFDTAPHQYEGAFLIQFSDTSWQIMSIST
jgi:hypothetical protein